MTEIGAPDLLISLRNGRNLARLDAELLKAATEMSTGLKSDLIEASSGDPDRLYALERDISLLEGRSQSLSLNAGRAEASQDSLARIQDALQTVGAGLAGAAERRDIPLSDKFAEAARGAFEDVVGALNTRFAGRALFAGAATTGAAVESADVILADVATLTAGAADAATASAIIDAYFDVGGGFDATGYLGSASDAPEAEVDEGVRVAFAARADDPAIRRSLAALATAVIAFDGAFAGANADSRIDLMGLAATRGLNAIDEVADRRGTLGVAEARIEAGRVATEAEAAMLSRARTTLLARDPFEAASEFTALEGQLQTSFAVVARLSQLRLVGFLS